MPCLGSFAVIKNHDPKKLGKESFILFFTVFMSHSLSCREARTGTQGKNLLMETKAEAMTNAPYCLTLHALISLLSYTAQDNLTEVGIAQKGLGPSTSIIN